MRNFIFFFTFIFCLLSNTNAAVFEEEVKYYDIEILLFENLKQNPNNTEIWPSSMEFQAPENSLYIGSPYPGAIPSKYNPRFTFKPIKASTYQLLDEAKALTEHEDFRIIYHRSWRQPGMNKDNAVSVIIEKDIPRIPYATAPMASQQALLNSDLVEYDKIINQRLPKINNLKGLITINLSRFLHIQTDIQFTQHVPVKKENETDPASIVIKPQVYQLKQTRKMRSKELHYLDNPKLGMLVYITPVKVAKPN